MLAKFLHQFCICFIALLDWAPCNASQSHWVIHQLINWDFVGHILAHEWGSQLNAGAFGSIRASGSLRCPFGKSFWNQNFCCFAIDRKVATGPKCGWSKPGRMWVQGPHWTFWCQWCFPFYEWIAMDLESMLGTCSHWIIQAWIKCCANQMCEVQKLQKCLDAKMFESTLQTIQKLQESSWKWPSLSFTKSPLEFVSFDKCHQIFYHFWPQACCQNCFANPFPFSESKQKVTANHKKLTLVIDSSSALRLGPWKVVHCRALANDIAHLSTFATLPLLLVLTIPACSPKCFDGENLEVSWCFGRTQTVILNVVPCHIESGSAIL